MEPPSYLAVVDESVPATNELTIPTTNELAPPLRRH